MSSNPYKNGVAPFVDLMTPTGHRVLLRAVLRQDGSDLAIDTDTTKAVCHQVVAVGLKVTSVRALDMVVHISAAGDLLDPEDQTSRYVLVHEDDIVVKWSDTEARAFAKTREQLAEKEAAAKRAAANGLILP